MIADALPNPRGPSTNILRTLGFDRITNTALAKYSLVLDLDPQGKSQHWLHGVRCLGASMVSRSWWLCILVISRPKQLSFSFKVYIRYLILYSCNFWTITSVIIEARRIVPDVDLVVRQKRVWVVSLKAVILLTLLPDAALEPVSAS